MNKKFTDLTVILVSFKSDEQITRLVSKIDKRIKIIIVENSLNKDFKNFIEKKYENIKVFIPRSNKGWGSAINYAIKGHVAQRLSFRSTATTNSTIV